MPRPRAVGPDGDLAMSREERAETTDGLLALAEHADDETHRQRLLGPGLADGAGGLAFMPDGRIVYTSTASGLPQLWIVEILAVTWKF